MCLINLAWQSVLLNSHSVKYIPEQPGIRHASQSRQRWPLPRKVNEPTWPPVFVHSVRLNLPLLARHCEPSFLHEAI